MKGSLILHPKPFHDESLKGYIIRLAELNLCPDIFIFYKMAGLRKSHSVVNVNMVKEKVNLTNLSTMTTCTEDQLVSLSFNNELGKSNENSKKTNKIMIQGTLIRKQQICSLCLSEKGYHRKLWDLSIVTTCPTHLCLLIDECPRCRKKISSHRSNLMKCRCGYDLRKAPIVKVSAKHTYLSNLINKRMFSQLPITPSTINPLENLEILDLIYLVMFFCEAKSNYHDGIKQYRFVHNYKSADLHELIQNSISIFNEWPTSFYNFLDGMRTNLNSFYKRLYLCLPYPEFLFIHQEFVNYYEQNEDSIYFKTSYKETLEKKIISQKHLLIKSNQLNDLKYCTTNEVSDLLGLKQRVQIVALGKKEIIRLVNDANLISRYNFVFDRQSVENLLKEIQIFMQEPPEEITSIISFQEALRIFTNWGQKLTDFLHSIMTKQIRACGRSNEIGLYSFLFIASEVESVVKGGWLSINDIAHEQGIDRKEICSWIDKGFLPAKRVQNHYFLITPIDFQKFNELYVTARELVKIHPEIHSSGKLFRVLVSMGVEPVSGPKIDGGARYLYKRDSSLMQLLGLKDS